MCQFAFVGGGRSRRSMYIIEALIIFTAYQSVVLTLPRLFDSYPQQALNWYGISGMLLVGSLYCAALMLSMTAVGLYNPRIRERLMGVIRRVVISALMAVALLAFIAFITPQTVMLSPIYYWAIALSLAAILLVRFMLARRSQVNLFRWRTVVLGAGKRAQIVSSRMRRSSDRRAFNLVAFVRMPGDAKTELQGERCIERMPSNLAQWALENNIDELVIGCDERRSELPVQELFECRNSGIKVIDILDFIERETGQIAVNLLYPSWIIYSKGFQPGDSLRQALNRIFNIAIAATGLILASPLMLLTAIAVKLGDGGPVLFSQVRVGQHGKLFKIHKFRSMRVDAEKNGARWATANDSRVTPVGRFIRDYRLDELPQLFNVLIGDMDFIGPRPERPEFVQKLSDKIPYYNERHNVKPGLTGWAQMQYRYGASEEDALEKLKYDLYYIKNRSALLDFNIFIRTVEVLLFAKGVH